jgi:hypothetical protein
VSEPHVVTDCDECLVGESLEIRVQGTGFVPYPATPGPRPRPPDAGEGV